MAEKKQHLGNNDVEWRSAICGICPAACWVKTGIKNGKIVDIMAESGHPLGMICRRGKHSPEIVYSEDRLRYPLKRKGKKGNYEFERISWDEAYDIITENLNRIKEESGPEAVSVYTGRGAFELSLCDMYQPQDAAVSSASNILFPFGSPNTMGVGALCYVSFAMIAPHVTMGRMLINMFTDMENAELLLIWGANPATDSPPLDMKRLEAAAKRGAEIIVIDPRKTETAYRTDAEWIPIRPGTDGALALSLIEVLIEEDYYDEDFAVHYTHGFDELRQYTQHFTPEKAAAITGIPAPKIRELARKIGNASGACPVMYTGLEYSNTGLQAIRAVLTLFALAGHLDVPGGMGLALLDSQFPINHACNQPNPDLNLAVARDRFPLYSKYRGESHALGLVDAVLHSDPYKIRGLIIHGASILTSWPQTSVWRETLSKLDFLVTIDRQLTADSAYADVVLPATTMFEIDSYAVYGSIFRLREKVIEPVGEARNDYLIMAELAERLGYGHLYPQTEEEMIRLALKGSGFTLEEIKEKGGWVKIPSKMMEYKKWEKGGLRKDGKPGFETPTGKFEIWSTLLEDYGYEPLPKYTEPVEGPQANPAMAKEYPLVFNSGARTHTEFRSQFHGIPGLLKDNPEPTVTMNAKDAEERGITSGDLVTVSTARNNIPFRAIVTDDIAQGSVECNMGGGTPIGPKAWQEWNVNELTDINNLDEISGFPVYKALLCEIKKAEEGAESRIPVKQFDKTAFEAAQSKIQKKKPERIIYLDNNATSPVDERVKDAMLPFLNERFGNPSSIHSIGRDAKQAIEKARRSIAKLINVRPRSLIFTAGGSESDNLAIKGTAFALRDKGNHIITTNIEHPAVLQTCGFLERYGFDVTYLEVDRAGMITTGQLEEAMNENTILVSIMAANNEVGTILPIKELAAAAHKRNVLFHTDAVQAIGKIPVDAADWGVDMLSLSGHKFHGPKGVGVLYVKRGVSLEQLIHGGKQEEGMRAGTENVAAIAGIGKAAEIALADCKNEKPLRELRDKLERGIKELIPAAVLNGHRHKRLPNTLNMMLPELRGESIVISMDQFGIYLSSGSACKSGSPKPTHVLMAMGRTEEEAHCAVRFSLSHRTTEKDIDDTIDALKSILEEMETTVRFLSCK